MSFCRFPSLNLASFITFIEIVLCGGKVSGIVDGRKTTKDAVGLMMTKIGG